ncbi:MAG TPA: M28 family peptidase, partial [Candidatus Thermoplasmatota archaeon]|nr:M28 family peptidase [Candidatus Thermoplasmatota archaeon]
AEQPDEWVVVGAHYDMVTVECGLVADGVPLPVPGAPECLLRNQSQGAYDDGSGTMMVLHMARAFADVSTPYTIAFVAFDGEERGLQGSRAFYDAMLEGNHSFGAARVRAMLNLDMFGLNCPGVDAPTYFDTNSPELAAFLKSYAQQHTPACASTIKYQGITLGRSDYHWFYIDESGIPTAFFISDFEEWQLPADLPYTVTPPPVSAPLRRSAYPFWHIQDTYETMELMAGSAADLEAGFQVALDWATAVLTFMATHNEMTAQPPQ